MKLIHVLFVIGVSINPVFAEDYEDGKALIEKGKNLDALNNFSKAVIKGYFKSQLYLSLVYDEGMGVETDKTAAAIWYLKAAEQAYMDAQ